MAGCIDGLLPVCIGYLGSLVQANWGYGYGVSCQGRGWLVLGLPRDWALDEVGLFWKLSRFLFIIHDSHDYYILPWMPVSLGGKEARGLAESCLWSSRAGS